MKTEIHDLHERFLDEIDLIEQKSFKHPWSKQAYRDEINNPVAVYKVITVDDKVVSYGGFWQIFDEGHITNICVKEEYRRQGFGKMLMEAIIKEARQRKLYSLTLEVRVSNIGAIKLYENFGFKSAGVRPKYYPDGEDAMILWLEGIYT